MDIMEICNNIEKRLVEEGLVGKRLGSGYSVYNQSRDVNFEGGGHRDDARAHEIVKEEVAKDESFDYEVRFGESKNELGRCCNFGFIVKPKKPIETDGVPEDCAVKADRENLKKLLRLSKARKIIESMLPFMPKENIEGVYEIVQMAEDFLKEEAKYDEPTLMEEEYILVSLKHTDLSWMPNFVMWRDEYSGYTTDFNKAGRYTISEMKEHWKGLPSWLEFPKGKIDWHSIHECKFDTLAIPVDQLEKFGFMTKTFLVNE
jgi:hypothetical protein